MELSANLSVILENILLTPASFALSLKLLSKIHEYLRKAMRVLSQGIETTSVGYREYLCKIGLADCHRMVERG